MHVTRTSIAKFSGAQISRSRLTENRVVEYTVIRMKIVAPLGMMRYSAFAARHCRFTVLTDDGVAGNHLSHRNARRSFAKGLV